MNPSQASSSSCRDQRRSSPFPRPVERDFSDETGRRNPRRAHVAVVGAAHRDLGVDVLVTDLSAVGIDVDHCALDVEERDHLGAVRREP
jgi:hypothetical protein